MANITDYVGEKGCTKVIQISLHTAKINPETTTTHNQIRMTALQKTARTELHQIQIILNYREKYN